MTRADDRDGDRPQQSTDHRSKSGSEDPGAETPDVLQELARTRELLQALARSSHITNPTLDALDSPAALARAHGAPDQSFSAAVLQELAAAEPVQPTADLVHSDQPIGAPPVEEATSLPSDEQLSRLLVELKTRHDGPRAPPVARVHRRRLPMSPSAMVGFAAAVLAAGLAALLWVLLVEQKNEPRTEQKAERRSEIAASAPTVRASPPPTAPAELSAEAVQTAMAQCDQEAGQNPFSLHFLVTPVVAASSASQPATLPGEAYDSFFLATSESVLDGLRNKTLTVNGASYRFAIIDSATGKTQIWGAASGLSKFTHSDTAAFAKFRVGFDVPDKGPQWTAEYRRRAGVCYWVNARFGWR